MSALPLTATELAAELADAPAGARVFAQDPKRRGRIRPAGDLPVTDGRPVTRVEVHGGDVYLETEEAQP